MSAVMAVTVGLIMAADAMHGAWDLNLGGDIHSDGIIHWDYWLIVGLFWFVPISSIVFILGLLTAGIIESRTRSKPTVND